MGEESEFDYEELDKRKIYRKLYSVLNKLIAGNKLKEMEYRLEKIYIFDFYRFFRRYGKVKHSATMNKEWGPYFKEAVIKYRDFIIVTYHDLLERSHICRIYHRRITEIEKFWGFLEKWIMENNVFREREFTYPDLGRIRAARVSYINDSTKELVEENTTIFFRKLKQLRRHKLKTRRGIILYGNPGNGKTSICRYISRNLPGVTRIWVTDWYMDPERVEEVFCMARKFSPSIIFFEDIDSVGVSRRLAGGINPFLGKLLNEMDGIRSNDGVVVVATTNDIHVLDEALARRPGRFDLSIYVGNPQPEIVKRITGHEDDITLAEAFRRKHDRIFYEKILGKKYLPASKSETVHYIE